MNGIFPKNSFFFLLLILMICGSSQIMCAQNKSRNKPSEQKTKPQYNCLPSDIKLDTVVSVSRKAASLRGEVERETVKQRLDKLGAKCRSGKLVDGKNREIRFYQLQGCWGNPPFDYLEILDNQRRELDDLKKKYTVIEITCNPSGEMPF
jgi:hypothetical protein